MPKAYLKGFSNFGYLPSVSDSATAYTASGTRVKFEGAVSCSKADNRNTEKIAADDNPSWDTETTWDGTTLTTVVRQMELSHIQFLAGADSIESVVEEGVFDEAPEVALTFRALKKNGGYRAFRYYRCKLTGCECNLNTLGENTKADVALTFECTPRSCDGKVRGTADFTSDNVDGCLTWLAAAISKTVSGSSSAPALDEFASIQQVASLPASAAFGVLYQLTAESTDPAFDAYAFVYWNGSAYVEYAISD